MNLVEELPRRLPVHLRRANPLNRRKIYVFDLGDLYAESGQTLQGSFSAVSKPNFASKCSLESSRRDLHNALLCTVLESNPKNQENHGELCTVLESIIENWGKRTWPKQPRKGVHRFGIESQKPGKPWGEKNLVQTTTGKNDQEKLISSRSSLLSTSARKMKSVYESETKYWTVISSSTSCGRHANVNGVRI